MNTHVVFWSWLDVRRWHPKVGTKAWLDSRIALWRRTALASIRRQRVAPCAYVLFCHPDSRHLTTDVASDLSADPLLSFVRVVHATYAEPGLMRDTADFRASLPAADRYVVARLDSDDRYHPDVTGILERQATQTGLPYLQFNDGYAFVERTGHVHPWRQRSSPFYARIYGPELRDPDTPFHAPTHHDVRACAKVLPAGHFCVTIHGQNTSTRALSSAPSARALGEAVSHHQARRVREAFGI